MSRNKSFSDVSAETAEAEKGYPEVGETTIDGDVDSATAEKTIEYDDGSKTVVTTPLEVRDEDATISTEGGGDSIVTASGKVVTQADLAQVGSVASGVDADGVVGGYDPTYQGDVLRPADAAPYISSADEQRDLQMHADLAARSNRQEREQRASDDLAAAVRS